MIHLRSIHARSAALALSFAGFARSSSGQELIWKSFGDHASQHLGIGVGSVGDLTGDGVRDVLVEQPFDAASTKGMVRVLSGSDGSTVVSILGASPGDELGSAADLGDVDGDGVCDFVVGAPGVDNTSADQGVVIAYSGRTRAPIYSIFGGGSDFLGSGLATLGDVDGDGIGDFVAGTGANYALVMSGVDGAVIWKLTDPKTPVFFAGPVGGGGDIDGDGVPDIVVGDYYSNAGGNNGGAVWAFSGKTGAVLYEFDSTVKKAYFGYSITIPGDVDDDGFADILIGAPVDGHVVTDGGSATVYSGKDGSLLRSFNAPSDGSIKSLGRSVCGAGDTNDDGFADFFVGDPAQAQTFLYSGRDGGLLYHLQDFSNPLGLSPFPAAMALAGDLDGDGQADFIMSATAEDDGSSVGTGSVSTWHGHSFFVDTTPRVASAYVNVTATVGQGIPGYLYALFIRDFNGTPMFDLLSFGGLDSNGHAFLTGTIPFGVGTNTLALQAFTLDANNHLVASGVETFYTE